MGGIEAVGPAALGWATVGPSDDGPGAATCMPNGGGGGGGDESELANAVKANVALQTELDSRKAEHEILKAPAENAKLCVIEREHKLEAQGGQRPPWTEAESQARRLQMGKDEPRLEALVRGVLQELRPTPSFQHRQGRLFQRLECILKELWPHALLEIFGSSVCSLAGKNSDLDMTFSPRFPLRLGESEKKSVLRKVSKALQNNGMRAVPVLGARVPIVKITDLNDTWLAVDLSVENELPVFKSRLLHEYSLIDARFSQLVLIVKAWAKARDINSAAHGTLNSFGLSLLVVHYLQNVEPPILPRLNEETIELRGEAMSMCLPKAAQWLPSPPRVHGECDGLVVRHHTHHQLRGWGSDNKRSTGMLVQDFFRYFSRQFQWSQHVVSVTSRGPVHKSAVCFHKGQNTCICIQDPLDLQDNCARSVGRNTYERLLEEFERAYSLDYDTLLQEARSGATRSGGGQQDARRKREQNAAKRKLKNAERAAHRRGLGGVGEGHTQRDWVGAEAHARSGSEGVGGSGGACTGAGADESVADREALVAQQHFSELLSPGGTRPGSPLSASQQVDQARRGAAQGGGRHGRDSLNMSQLHDPFPELPGGVVAAGTGDGVLRGNQSHREAVSKGEQERRRQRALRFDARDEDAPPQRTVPDGAAPHLHHLVVGRSKSNTHQRRGRGDAALMVSPGPIDSAGSVPLSENEARRRREREHRFSRPQSAAAESPAVAVTPAVAVSGGGTET
jgi:DNA polymerase sigma